MFLILLLAVEVKCYAKSSTVLGSRYTLTEWEEQTDSQLASFIFNCSLASNYTSYNWYGSSTTQANIYEAAQGAGHVFSTSFYIGEGYNDKIVWLIEKHYEIATDNGTKVSDDWIHQYSGCQNDRFVFLWSCYQGETIGGTHFWSGAYGMPHCWLHTTNLSDDGYADPDNSGYAFIGFTGTAPHLTLRISTDCAGYKFAGYFYQAALKAGCSINAALDEAAFKVWNVDSFSDSVFCNGFVAGGVNTSMVVYGDGNLEIGAAVSTPSLPSPPPEPGGGPQGSGECPTLFAWNGTDYVSEGVLPIHAESDITVQHTIQNTLALENGVYRLELRELDNFTSHLDQVRLYAVDDQGEWHLSPLLCAYLSELGWVTWKLRFDDDNRVDMTPTQTIALRFAPSIPSSETAYFVFEVNGHNRKALY